MRTLSFILISMIFVTSLASCGDDNKTPLAELTPTSTPSPSPTATPSPTSPITTTPDITPSPTPEAEEPIDYEIIKASINRNLSPEVGESHIEELVSGNNAFAFDLYSEMRSEDGNLLFSPYSISTALAMTYAGAQGETEEQMADVLHFTQSQEDLHPALNALDIHLTTGDSQQATEGKFVLNIANSLWGQEGYPFVPDFLETVLTNYSAGIEFVDFINDYEPERLVINDWVSEQTAEKIKDLIPEGGVNKFTRLVLVNAIYFYSDWRYRFSESSTRDRDFHLLDGEEIVVPMMWQIAPFRYSSGDGYQAVELPYVGDTVAMTIIVPDAGNFTSFESGLNINVLQGIIADLQQKKVSLAMPKFSYEYDISLARILAEMGMPRAFDSEKAEFFGIVEETPEDYRLYIFGVFHKAFVAVDEKGTEAAAATAISGCVAIGVPTIDVSLNIDRPFIYLIRDTSTGSILFMGRVLDPS